jgi:hypothetical protein
MTSNPNSYNQRGTLYYTLSKTIVLLECNAIRRARSGICKAVLGNVNDYVYCSAEQTRSPLSVAEKATP